MSAVLPNESAEYRTVRFYTNGSAYAIMFDTARDADLVRQFMDGTWGILDPDDLGTHVGMLA